MQVYKYIHAYIHTYMHTYVCMCMRVCTGVRVSACSLSLYICMCENMYIHNYMHVYTLSCMLIYIYVVYANFGLCTLFRNLADDTSLQIIAHRKQTWSLNKLESTKMYKVIIPNTDQMKVRPGGVPNEEGSKRSSSLRGASRPPSLQRVRV